MSSGFDLASLLPYYLDETDEQIAGLNEMLLKLEQEPGDEKALRETFRVFHSIKGSSAVMGFAQVKELTHHLETCFDLIRSGKRALDRGFLDLCFRCLDSLRDYHTNLRAHGDSNVDLSDLTALVISNVEGGGAPIEPTVPPKVDAPLRPEPAPTPDRPTIVDPLPDAGVVVVTVRFEPDIPWPDMKARLVLSRLATKGRVVSTDPPVERLEQSEGLTKFTIWLASEGDLDEFHALADVEGVTDIDISTAPSSTNVEPVAVAPSPSLPPPVLPEEQTIVESALGETRRVVVAPTPAAPVATSGPVIPAEPRKARVVETVRVDADRLDYLMNLAGELVINKARFAEISRGLEEVFRGSNAELLAAETMERLDAILRGFEGKDGPEAAGGSSRWAAQFRRLRENFHAILEDLDQVRQGRERLNAMAEAIHHLGRVSDGIQKGVLETRMVPIGPLFDRFHRVIRDLRMSSLKEVALKIEGQKTELDKRMIDELADPLIHMVRNSVDHGLESPEIREAAGKSRTGTVLLAASHRGNSVVITVSDDGRGIDCARVRQKAVANGLLSEDDARRMTDRQVMPFIFHPGLSTAESVTDISGRGVGMDIVKSRIEDLNGSLDLRSEPGVGTTFMIRLPLTLAIMPVLLVRVGGEAYAIPLDHLDEIVEVRPEQVYHVHARPSIEVRDRIIALVKLDELFRRGAGRTEPTISELLPNGKQTVVVVSNGESTIGLVVDQLLGMQEAVLKSLEKNFRPVPGLSGASILGDGRVSLILDIDALIDMAALEILPSVV